MDDLIERLRDPARRFIFQGGSFYANDLANKIETLQLKKKEAEDLYLNLWEASVDLGKTIAKLKEMVQYWQSKYERERDLYDKLDNELSNIRKAHGEEQN